MSAHIAPSITSAEPGRLYLTFAGRRLRVKRIARDIVYYFDEAAPSIELWSAFPIFALAVESVIE